jgi:hypothetical protein
LQIFAGSQKINSSMPSKPMFLKDLIAIEFRSSPRVQLPSGVECSLGAHPRKKTMQNAAHEEVSVIAEATPTAPVRSLGTSARDSAAIQRLLDEVKNETTADFSASYNRMHNRHNR